MIAPPGGSLRLDFRVPGDPVPQNTGKVGRWRSKDGREGVTVRQPAKVVRYKLELEERMRAAVVDAGWWGLPQPLFGEAAVSLRIIAVFALPVSEHRKRQHVPRRPHTGRYGNCDNLAKAIGDAGEGVLWRDDGQICCLSVSKWVGEQGEPPHVRIVAELFGYDEM